MRKLKAKLTGVAVISLIVVNTIAVCIPLFVFSIVKILGPRSLYTYWNRKLDHWVIDGWVGTNRWIFRLLKLTRVQITWEAAEDITRDKWYMVISNHQSWTDILVLQTSLIDHIPPIKFFTKRQLIWVPFVGVAMWLLGFPYVRRASKTEVVRSTKRNRKSDREATLRACEGFRNHPTTVLNFLEGTRFTPEKHARQSARFNHLLNPKIGGLSYVMGGLNNHLHKLLDITILYPEGTPTFWEFIQGLCPSVVMYVHCRDIPTDLRAIADDSEQRKLLGPWIDDLWVEKDQRIASARAG